MMHGWIRAPGKRQLSRILEAGTVCRTYVGMSAPLPDHVRHDWRTLLLILEIHSREAQRKGFC